MRYDPAARNQVLERGAAPRDRAPSTSPRPVGRRRRAEWCLAALLYAALVAVLNLGLWHGPQGQPTALGWDVVDSYGPNLEYMARELASQSWSLWNPYDKGGYPMFCDPQMDRFYPLNWPFMALGAWLGSPWWLIQVKALAHRVVAGLTMHGFLRSHRARIGGAVVGAVAVLVCVPRLADNVLWPLVWVPLAWIAIDRFTEEPTVGRGAALAAVLYILAAAGSPPGIFDSLMLVVLYALWRLGAALASRRERHAAGAYLRRLAPALGACLLLLASLLLVIWAPTLWLLPQTARAAEIGRSWALAVPLPARASLIGVLLPSRGRADLYLGIATLALALFAIAGHPRDEGGLPIVLGLTAALGIVLTLGDQTPVLPWLIDHVPGFRDWRAPVRYRALTVFAACACAGLGASFLLGAITRRLPRAVVWLTTAALVVFIPWDVARATQPGGPVREARRLHLDDDARLGRFPGIRDSWRIYDEFVFGESVGLRKAVRDFRGYPPLDPLCLRRYVDVLEAARRHPEILEAYNVRWVFHAPHFRFGFKENFVEPRPDVTSPEHFSARPASAREPDTFESLHPVPLVAWYGAALVVQDPRDVLGAVLATESHEGSRYRAVVETSDADSAGLTPTDALASAEPAPLPAQAGTLVSYRPDRIEAQVVAPARGLVVLNELFVPGWRVSVDGVAAHDLRANYLLRSVVVDAGPHRIVWEYGPRWFPPLLVLWAAGMATLAATALHAAGSRGRA